ncbi:MAG: DUF4097 family beta strand repeat protein [Lunatimonas sp.]|uniref:DUF4097 family beta strand repeat-containing protein n=1 Tax=Lunatimonas sp. TaxID=2060141 RepID=UPI00263B8861|nr:DUF4097 family beta strand repeat-containing protein [Lunatimonas sp.]MCC5936294.1 DUF4097 family beta strand repeat protein [Lunatimonas sp.]
MNKIVVMFVMGAIFALGVPVFGQELIEKTFTGIEVMEMDIGGVDLVYTGVPGKEDVSLSALFGKAEDGARNFFMVTLGNTLKISYKSPAKPNPSQEKRFIHIEGPEDIRINGKNSSGLLSIRNVRSAETKLSVNSGIIRAQQISGGLIVKANSGKIEVQQVNGGVTCTLTSGEADLSDVSGDVSLSANSGSLKGKALTGLVHVKISSGNVRLDQVGELGNVTVSSGNVKISKVGLGSETQFQGSSGNIEVGTVSDLQAFNFDLSASSGSLRVGNVSNAKSLQIDNGSATTIRGAMRSGSLRINH